MGKTKKIYVDNGSDFHSQALKFGCEVHGIELDYRPIGQPHYGGIVERVIGTLMELIDRIPGTTFSNIKQKGLYDSEKKAILTLSELEKWLTLAIVNYYHQRLHTVILMPPLEKYKKGILGSYGCKGAGYPPQLLDAKAFLIDFLPIEKRTLQKNGFLLDHIVYYSNAISPLIAIRKKYKKFTIIRDPRNISCIYVLDPISTNYIEVPYRNILRPTITIWEHRAAI